MSVLEHQQQRLLAALWQPRHEDAVNLLADGDCGISGAHWRRGLKAYRSNGHELARRALAAAYPVVAQLLGDENFEALARTLWQSHPPARGDIALWGAELAAQIESLPGLREEEPYLADVARVEWLLHAACTAADAQVDVASFALLTERDPQQLTLVLCPGARCWRSSFPVASIVMAHLGEGSVEEAGALLRAGTGETALVWREGFTPRLRIAAAAEAAFIASLQQKPSLAEALDCAPELEFNNWLATAVQSGLVVAAAAIE